MDWLTHRFREGEGRKSGSLQIMYGIDGRAALPERVLEHLEGYRGSAPVRIGRLPWEFRVGRSESCGRLVDALAEPLALLALWARL